MPAVGARFAHALAAKDFEAISDLLHPDVDFVALTPGRAWQARGPAKMIDGVLRPWLDGLSVEQLSDVQVEQLSDCQRLSYRVHGRSGGRPFVFEQQAYLQETSGQISWVRLLCSGLRPPMPAGPELSVPSSDGNAEAIAGPGGTAVLPVRPLPRHRDHPIRRPRRGGAGAACAAARETACSTAAAASGTPPSTSPGW